MTASQPLLSVKDLRVRYGPALALDNVSIEISAGQALAVLGPNGAGKSTLARPVSGLVPGQAGTVRFDGADVARAPAHQIRRLGLVYLPEGRGIFPALTVVENLRIAATLLPRDDRKAAISRGLEIFPSLAARRTGHTEKGRRNDRARRAWPEHRADLAHHVFCHGSRPPAHRTDVHTVGFPNYC